MFPELQVWYDESVLKKLREGQRDAIILGKWPQSTWCFNYLRKMEVKVRYFCSVDPVHWGTKFLDRRVIDPAELPKHLGECEVFVAGEEFLPVAKMIDFYAPGTRPLEYPHYAPHTLQYAIENQDRVRAAHDLFEDDYSKRLFLELLRYRVTLEGQRLRALATQPKYFPPDIFILGSEEVFVDGGAHNGETIVDFAHAVCGEFAEVHAFEPDPRCAKLVHLRPLTKAQYQKIHINDVGLGERDEVLHIKMAESVDYGTSEIGGEGGTTVKIRSLDSYLEGRNITFYKLDVEKHERQALRGARETLQRCKPKLAICVYHLHDDLWEIPLLVKEMVPDYRLHLRHHSHGENETVLYAQV